MAIDSKEQVWFRDLGIMEYQAAWDYQERLLKENVKVKQDATGNRQPAIGSHESSIVNSELPAVGYQLHTAPASERDRLPTQHYLLFVEHPPVYTLGKSGDTDNLLLNNDELNIKGIEFFRTNRGGDITFHGKEQIVGYPILDLEKFFTDIGKYLRCLEEVIILTMAEYGLKGERSPGETGVWMDTSIKGKERKICAMGIRCSRWITMHGFAFNVNTDLTYFNHIIPCGIQNKQVTSLQKELGHTLNLDEVKDKLKKNFEKVFNVELVKSSEPA